MWFRKWLFIFDSFLILSQTTHLSFTTSISDPLHWRIQGRDPGVRPPLTFWPNWGKIVSWRPAHPFFPPPPPPSTILGSEWSTSALISRSGSVTALRVTYYILYHSKTLLNGGTYFFLYKIWLPTSSWGSSDSPNDLWSPGLRFPFLFCHNIMKLYLPFSCFVQQYHQVAQGQLTMCRKSSRK